MVFRFGFCFAALVAVAFLAAGGSDLFRGQSEVPTAPNGGKVTVRGAIRIHDMDRLQLKVFVPAKQGKRIRVGAPAVVGIDAFPDRLFSGQVSKVSPNAESDSAFQKGVNEFSVIVSLNESPHGAKPGLTAVVEIDVPNPE